MREARSLHRRLGLATLLMVGSALLSRVIGFVREAVIAAQQGATGATDAYFAAFTLPDLLSYFLAGGTLSITFIPLFSRHLTAGDEEGGWRLFSTVATGVGLLVASAVVLGELFAPWLVPLLNPGFGPEQLALCVELTRIVLPAMLCFTLGGLLQATLLSRERFAHVAAIPIVYNVMIILGGVVLGPWLGVAGFAWGALAGAVVGPLLIPLVAAWPHLRYRPRLELRSEGFRTYLKLALPLMLGVSLVSVDEWLLRWFGSYLDAGTVTHLNNARRLMLVPFAIIGQAAGQAALPFLSRLWNEGRVEEMAETLTRSLANTLFFALIASLGLGVLAEPVVFVAYQRGLFTPEDARETAAILAVLCAAIAAWSVQSVAARGFYARQNTLEPMLIGTGVVVLAAPLYGWLGELGGVVGLAWASVAGITLNAAVTVLVFRVRHAPVRLGALAASGGRALLAGGAGAAAAWGLLRWGGAGWAPLLQLGWGGVVFSGVALGVAGALRAPELEPVLRRLRRRA